MNKYVQEGNVINYKNATTTDIKAGDVVVIGKLVGVAACDIAPDELGSVAISGVYSINKDTTIAINQGDVVYYDDTKKIATTTAGTHILGICVNSAIATDNCVDVKLLTSLA